MNKESSILLINPATTLNVEGQKPNRFPLTVASVGTPFLHEEHFSAAFRENYGINPPGARVNVVDERVEGSETAEKISLLNPDIVGITATSLAFNRACEIAHAIKEVNPEVITVLGGAHVTAVPQDLEETDFDYGIQGPGEEPLCLLVHSLTATRPSFTLTDIPGLVYKTDGEIVVNARQRPRVNFAENPPVRAIFEKDLLKPTNYNPNTQLIVEGGKIRGRLGVLVFSRGCPYACTFCANPNKHSPEYRQPKDVAEDIESLYHNFDFPIYHFFDDTFTFDQNQTGALMKAIEQLKLDRDRFEWTAGTRVEKVNLELLSLMKQAGCCGLGLGVEAANDCLNYELKKGIKMHQVLEATRLCHQAGLGTKWFLMVGLENQTWQHILEMISFIKQAKPTGVSVSSFIPLPGSVLYDRLSIKPRLDSLAMKPKLEQVQANTPFLDNTHPSNVMTAEEIDLARRLVNLYNMVYKTGEGKDRIVELLYEIGSLGRSQSDLIGQFKRLID